MLPLVDWPLMGWLHVDIDNWVECAM